MTLVHSRIFQIFCIVRFFCMGCPCSGIRHTWLQCRIPCSEPSIPSHCNWSSPLQNGQYSISSSLPTIPPKVLGSFRPVSEGSENHDALEVILESRLWICMSHQPIWIVGKNPNVNAWKTSCYQFQSTLPYFTPKTTHSCLIKWYKYTMFSR